MLQVAADPSDSSPRVAVIWHKKRPDEDVALTLGGESNLASDAGKYADQTALDIGLFSAAAVKGKRDQAAEDIERLSQQLTEKPDNPAVLRARGMASVNLGRDDQAIQDLTKILEKGPADVQARHFLAVAQARLGNRAAAAEALAEIAKRAGDSSQAAYSRAVVAAILGSDAEAVAALEEAVNGHANDSGFLYDAACAYALIAEQMENRLASREASAPGLNGTGGPVRGLTPTGSPENNAVRQQNNNAAPRTGRRRLSATVTERSVLVRSHRLTIPHSPSASVWVRPQVSESMLDESARRNALAAPAMLQLGEQENAWGILQQTIA